jgi:hypothetical protein
MPRTGLAMPKKNFTAKLDRFEGVGTWIYADVPFDVEKVFGRNGQVKVKGTVNGVAFRSSLMPHGDGTHFLVVNKAVRERARVDVGKPVRVVLEIDAEKREVGAPPDLAKALAGNKAAKTNWDTFAYSHKKAYVDWITDAKKEETRRRRVEQAVAKLAAGALLK